MCNFLKIRGCKVKFFVDIILIKTKEALVIFFFLNTLYHMSNARNIKIRYQMIYYLT